jgi:hypothetical protein
MRFFPLCLRVLPLTLYACLLSLQPQTGSSQTEGEETQFDTVEIGALNLAFEVKQWLVKIAPTPSEALQKLVESRPIAIIIRGGGKQWYIRPPDRRSPVPIDVERFPIQSADLESAEGLLNIAYLTKWISCTRFALDGSASQDMLDELRKLAEAEPEPARTTLLENLGARIVSLSARNPEWLAAIRANSDAVSAPLLAYRKLESDKALVALQFYNGTPTPDESGLAKVTVVKNFGVEDWSDFARAIAVPHKASGALTNRIVTWSFGSEGKLVSNNDQLESITKAVVATFVLTPDQHVLLTGNLNNEKLEAIQKVNSLDQLISTSKQYELTPFLSRPGSAKMLMLERTSM